MFDLLDNDRPFFAGEIESDETLNDENEFVLSIFHWNGRGPTFFDEFKS